MHDPRDWSIRYVGKANNPERRARNHFKHPGGVAFRRFVTELKSLGLSLRVSVLQKCSQDDWANWEKFWIATVRKSGAKLFNISEGGNAPATTPEKCRLARIGKKDSEQTRLRKSLAAKGKSKSPEHVRNAAEAQRGKLVSSETRKKMSLAKLGKSMPESFSVKHSSTMCRKWNDPAYREKVSAGLRASWRKRLNE